MRYFLDIILVFSITTATLTLLTNKLIKINNFKRSLQREKKSFMETLRKEKLSELQKTIFVGLNRPSDHTYNTNVTLSERLSLEREIPDVRHARCRRDYDVSKLPTISVVIPFHNDALSMILRTVHSILKRTPEELLREVAWSLVDSNNYSKL